MASSMPLRRESLLPSCPVCSNLMLTGEIKLSPVTGEKVCWVCAQRDQEWLESYNRSLTLCEESK